MSVLDPALLSTPPENGEDSEWEYEYDDTETETFFLNLDLTTNHGPLRPPRRRNDASASASISAVTTANPTPASSRPDDRDSAVVNSETDDAPSERVQVLGLHTRNPIISYQNQIFSGAWADQIGTELFFAPPDTTSAEFNEPGNAPAEITPLKHTKDFDLIAANSVKILGRKANLISSSSSAAEQRDALTRETSGLVYKPAHQSNQARFLERLKEVKRSKGETDTVRTVFSTSRRGPNLEDRLRGWVQTEEQLATIQQLNERAVQGDYDAMIDLENIYTQLGSQNVGPSEGPSRSG
ncbi:TFIIIC subunit 6 family protein [Aspergillus foveolatus]|uniref:TFIIIC subunit 6 family protein n=1 Tax=Aspergillus foveolatus TaxID=210207 RepID=UPI003CCE2028